jgi:Cyclic nucleotide-binding domain
MSNNQLHHVDAPRRPSGERMRTRVAVPVTTPASRPSLIPFDVMQEVNALRDPAVSQPTLVRPMVLEQPAQASREASRQVAIQALRDVALFRSLGHASLNVLARGARHHEVQGGQALFAEGDLATSFFVVLDGALEVAARREGAEVVLRHADRGEAFGLFGLVGGDRRTATARAIGDCSVLEYSAEALQGVLEQDDALHARVLRFFRERLVEGFVASPLFTEIIDPLARAQVIGRFRHTNLGPDSSLLAPGEVNSFIAVVTHGTLVAEERTRLGRAPRHFEVTQGEFLAVTSALSGMPSTMRVFAPVFAAVSVLDQKQWTELMRDRPALRGLPGQLARFSRQLDRDIFCGTTGVRGF